MYRYRVEREIAASPAQLWAVLTDASRLASGPFGITRIEGQIRPGARIRLWSDAAPGRAFALTVSGWEPGRRMEWRGGMPLGLFRGVRTFTLTPAGEKTRLVMEEVYSGPLAGMIFGSMPDLQPSFDQFAAALAAATEEHVA